MPPGSRAQGPQEMSPLPPTPTPGPSDTTHPFHPHLSTPPLFSQAASEGLQWSLSTVPPAQAPSPNPWAASAQRRTPLHPELAHTSPTPRGSQALGPEGRELEAAEARGQTPEARKGPGAGPQAEMSVFIACTVQTRGMRTGRWEEGELSG